MGKKLLLISNSTNYGENYLEYTKPELKKFLGGDVKKILFIPYAGVSMTYDEYHHKVEKVFNELGYDVESVHHTDKPVEAVMAAEAIVVGGGNTFHLLYMMQKMGLIEPIKERVNDGTPYIGWSAGSNMACPTLKTTNDMPVIEPYSFDALNLVPFQINPHYTDAMPPGHAGESREQRLLEFLEVNREIYVIGLKEASMLLVEDDKMKLIGDKPLRLFKHGEEIREYDNSASLDFLLE